MGLMNQSVEKLGCNKTTCGNRMPTLQIVYNKESPRDYGNEMDILNICFHVVQVQILSATFSRSSLI